MSGSNTLEYGSAQTSLNNLYEYAETVRTKLTEMNDMIDSSVNTGAGIWDGESASKFRTSWKTLADDIPTYIETFNKQVSNLSTMIEETHKADTVE